MIHHSIVIFCLERSTSFSHYNLSKYLSLDLITVLEGYQLLMYRLKNK